MQSISSDFQVFQMHRYRHWTPCSPREIFWLEATRFYCLFPGKVELNDVTQDGGVVARFSSKDFI